MSAFPKLNYEKRNTKIENPVFSLFEDRGTNILKQATFHEFLNPFYASDMFLYPLKTRASGFLVFLGAIKKDQCNEMVSEFLEFLFYLKLFDNLFKLEN